MKMIWIILAATLLPSLVLAASPFNFLTKGAADYFYCRINGACVLSELVVGNLSVIGFYFNVSVENYNVTGDIVLNGVSIEDIFVNEGGDSVRGPISFIPGSSLTLKDNIVLTFGNSSEIIALKSSAGNDLSFLGSGDMAMSIDLEMNTNSIYFGTSEEYRMFYDGSSGIMYWGFLGNPNSFEGNTTFKKEVKILGNLTVERNATINGSIVCTPGNGFCNQTSLNWNGTDANFNNLNVTNKLTLKNITTRDGTPAIDFQNNMLTIQKNMTFNTETFYDNMLNIRNANIYGIKATAGTATYALLWETGVVFPQTFTHTIPRITGTFILDAGSQSLTGTKTWTAGGIVLETGTSASLEDDAFIQLGDTAEASIYWNNPTDSLVITAQNVVDREIFMLGNISTKNIGNFSINGYEDLRLNGVQYGGRQIFSGYSSSTSTTSSSTFTSAPIDTVNRIDRFYYRPDGNTSKLAFNQSGWYDVQYDICINNSNANRASWESWLYENDSQVKGTRTVGYLRTLSNSGSCGTAKTYKQFAERANISIRFSVYDGSTTIENHLDGTRLNVEWAG